MFIESTGKEVMSIKSNYIDITFECVYYIIIKKYNLSYGERYVMAVVAELI